MSTPKLIGRYEIKTEIARGGMATVYHAYDPRFERDIAVKVLPMAFLHDPQFRVRFEREAKTIALLEHPAIVPVYDFGEDEGQPYIVMRYMSGGSLTERLEDGALSPTETVQIASRLAPALDAAHARKIIHRDLKPGNILFDQYGNAYLSDFGIARIVLEGSATITGESILGTPAYMSPEQVQGEKSIDGRSDIYSFGVLIFQMLSGQTPYQSDTPAKVMMMHVLQPVPDILDKKSDLPAGFQTVLARAMAKQPEERYPTAEELAADLEAVLQAEIGKGLPATIKPTGLPSRSARPDYNMTTMLTPGKTIMGSASEAAGALPAGAPAAQPTRRVKSSNALLWLIPLIVIGVLLLVGGCGCDCRRQRARTAGFPGGRIPHRASHRNRAPYRNAAAGRRNRAGCGGSSRDNPYPTGAKPFADRAFAYRNSEPNCAPLRAGDRRCGQSGVSRRQGYLGREPGRQRARPTNRGWHHKVKPAMDARRAGDQLHFRQMCLFGTSGRPAKGNYHLL
ncbi:MAG: serine/threonine protein kinase [Anaerolineales bacterium]|nr:serine/threonine protein kinase [Anaerolineales bacterium]